MCPCLARGQQGQPAHCHKAWPQKAPRLVHPPAPALRLPARLPLQPVRSFKVRGAYNKMSRLTPEQLEKGVVCSSAGNHAQVSCRVGGQVDSPAARPNRHYSWRSRVEPATAGGMLARRPPASRPAGRGAGCAHAGLQRGHLHAHQFARDQDCGGAGAGGDDRACGGEFLRGAGRGAGGRHGRRRAGRHRRRTILTSPMLACRRVLPRRAESSSMPTMTLSRLRGREPSGEAGGACQCCLGAEQGCLSSELLTQSRRLSAEFSDLGMKSCGRQIFWISTAFLCPLVGAQQAAMPSAPASKPRNPARLRSGLHPSTEYSSGCELQVAAA